MENERDSVVNSSSIIDLKAELFRKQEEFKKQQLQNKNANVIKGKTVEKKASIWSKKNKGVLERNHKDLEEKIEKANELEKSKKCLEAKAKLYEKITYGGDIPEEDGSQVYLVDFQKKAIDRIVEDRDRKRREEEEERERQEEELLSKAVVPPPASKEEEWVDYVDGFGRSRRCMKKDLPHVMKQDQKIHENDRDSSVKVDNRSAEMVSNDMYKEMLRQKWEEEEKAAMDQPIHYSNVQYDEVRTHGVGFYQFAKDEESRKEQLDALKDIREKTKDERNQRERIKEKRKAIMEARLAKVKQRKMKREGITDLPEEKDDEDDIGPKLSEAAQEVTSENVVPVKREPELLTRDDSLRGAGIQREWDKGKEKLFPMSSEQKYFESRRDERISDFAPPSMYFDSDSSAGSNVTQKTVTARSVKLEKKIDGQQISNFLSQERLKTQQSVDGNSKPISPYHMGSASSSLDGIQQQHLKPEPDFSNPRIEPEQVQDIPLPQTRKNPDPPNSSNSSLTQNLNPNFSQYPPPNLPAQQGTFYVPTHLPPPGYSQSAVPPFQQWPQSPHNVMQYHPSVPSTYCPTTSSYPVSSIPQENQSTEMTGSPQTSVVSNTVGICDSVQQTTKPTRYNIVDPRLIQNEEVLESTPQNFTPLEENIEQPN